MADLDYAGQHPISLIVQPAGLSVSAWSELRGRTRPAASASWSIASTPGVPSAGAGWVACWHTAAYGRGRSSDRITERPTAEEAVVAVVRSGWARRLGAPRASRGTWTPKARKLAARGGRPVSDKFARVLTGLAVLAVAVIAAAVSSATSSAGARARIRAEARRGCCRSPSMA